MLVLLSSLVKAISFSTHTTAFIFIIIIIAIRLGWDVHNLTGKFSVFISYPRAAWKTDQRAGGKAQSKGGIPVAHLPPGGSAVCRSPWHPRQDAGEGCHHCECELHKHTDVMTGNMCVFMLFKLILLCPFDTLDRTFWIGRMCGPSSTGVCVGSCWNRWWSVRFCRPTRTSVTDTCSPCCDAGLLKQKEQSRYVMTVGGCCFCSFTQCNVNIVNTCGAPEVGLMGQFLPKNEWIL